MLHFLWSKFAYIEILCKKQTGLVVEKKFFLGYNTKSVFVMTRQMSRHAPSRISLK